MHTFTWLVVYLLAGLALMDTVPFITTCHSDQVTQYQMNQLILSSFRSVAVSVATTGPTQSLLTRVHLAPNVGAKTAQTNTSAWCVMYGRGWTPTFARITGLQHALLPVIRLSVCTVASISRDLSPI